MLLAMGIIDFCSETAELNLRKLDRKQDLNILYQVCVFRTDQITKMAALTDSSTNVAHCTQVHDMLSFGPLVLYKNCLVRLRQYMSLIRYNLPNDWNIRRKFHEAC